MATQSVQSLALRPREAAKALGISPRLLWQLTHDGHVPCVRVGTGKRRTVLYPVSSLEKWLSQQAIAVDRRWGTDPLSLWAKRVTESVKEDTNENAS
jgi:excisionase family DNA binding protein